MSQSVTLAIGDVAVRQLDGLFSLNDLHAASGGDPNQRPGEFVRNEQTKTLIAEISNAGIPAIESKRGANGGTYACRELVIAYAAWISAAFHLKVIRVFLAQQDKPAAPDMPAPARALDVQTLCQLILGGIFTGRDFIDLAYAVNQHQFSVAFDNKKRGYGEEVVSKIKDLSWSDLHTINHHASLEVWLRSETPQKETS